jgi:large subunit ribosomal protein L25
MKEIAIPANRRQGLGKGPARQARFEGIIPAVVYGPEITPMSIAVREQDFRAALKAAGGESTIYTLMLDGQANKVIIREIQRDPVTSKIIHLDFHAISMNKPIDIRIPLHFVGTSKGVKSEGGIMQVLIRDLEISCLPVNIPEHVEVDVTELGIGDSIHVRDLNIPNVEILADASSTVVVISAPTIIKVEAPTAAETAAAEAEAAAAAEGAEGAEGAAAPGEEKKEAKKEEKKEEKKGKEKG